MHPTHESLADRLRPLAVLLPIAALLVSAPLWLKSGEPQWFLAVNQACTALPLAWWTYLSIWGTAWALLGATAPLLVWHPRSFLAWLCAAPLAVAAVRIGKTFIFSPRPPDVLEHGSFALLGEALGTASMPSGHTLTAFTVATALVFASAPALRKRLYALWLLAALTGLSRVALGAHWPSDVLVGAGIGLLCGYLGAQWARLINPARLQPQSWTMRALAVLVALAAYNLLWDLVDFPEALVLQRALGGVAVVSLLAFAMRNARTLKAS